LSRRRLNQRRAGDWRLCSNPGKSGDFKMKWTTLTAALVLFAVNSASAGLFGHHGLCCKKNNCCPEPTCCAPACDPGCAAPCDPGCAAPCAPACAAPCQPGCAAPACCAPNACGACGSGCGNGCGHGCGLGRGCGGCGGLMGWFKKHHRGCCAKSDCCAPAPSCCAPACDPGCAAPCAPACAAPCAPSCASPCGACR
jgi:hypothetical protein